MKFQLDRDAMFALFPEGSQAEVELRSAVTDAIVRRVISGAASWSVKDFESRARALAHEEARLAFADMGIGSKSTPWKTEITLSDSIKNAIRSHARDLVEKEKQEAAKVATEHYGALLEERIGQRFAVMVDAAFNERLEAIVLKVIKSRLGS